MKANIPTIQSRGRKWKVWVVDETDVTVTVRVRPLRAKNPSEFTLPFRREFSSFGVLASEAIDRYFDAQAQAEAQSRLRRGFLSRLFGRKQS